MVVSSSFAAKTAKERPLSSLLIPNCSHSILRISTLTASYQVPKFVSHLSIRAAHIFWASGKSQDRVPRAVLGLALIIERVCCVSFCLIARVMPPILNLLNAIDTLA